MTLARSRSAETRIAQVAGDAAQLRGLPGSWLRRALVRVLPVPTIAYVVDPILADLHSEWTSGPASVAARARLYLGFLCELTCACGLAAATSVVRVSSRRMATSSGAAVITLALLFFMQSLIATEAPTLRPQPPLDSRVLRRAVIPEHEVKKRESPDPERPRPIPPSADGPNREWIVSPPARPTPPAPPGTGPELILGPPGLEPAPVPPIAADPCLPIARVEPRYPDRAISRGIEGSVRVQLEIDTAGRVAYTRILESDSALFNRAVEVAVRSWRYRPSAPGQASSACGTVEVLLSFRLPE